MWGMLLAACVAWEGVGRTQDDGADVGPGIGEVRGPHTDAGLPVFRDVETREDAFLYGDETLDFSLELTDEAIDALATTRFQVDDAPYVPATFRWGAEAYTVGVRLKGGMGSFRPFDDKPSFRIDFASAYPVQRFHGSRWLTLNNLVQDDSMLGEHAAYYVYRARGHAACRHGFARVTINGEWFGLYGIVETLEHDFLVRNWPGDADGPLLDGGVDFVPGDEEGYVVAQEGDLAALYPAVAAVDEASPEDYLATLDQWFEAERLLDLWAIELASGNPDAYVTRHNNYYLYWSPGDARWTMLPWGTDTAFIDHLAIQDGWYEGRLYLKCLDAPACEQALRKRLEEVTTWFETGQLAAAMEAVGQRTETDCMEDPRSDGGAAGCLEGRQLFFGFLEDRSAELRTLLE